MTALTLMPITLSSFDKSYGCGDYHKGQTSPLAVQTSTRQIVGFSCGSTSCETDKSSPQRRKFGISNHPRNGMPRQLKKINHASTSHARMHQRRAKAQQLATQRRNKHLAKRRKRVCFHESTKTHDGLTPENAQLQRLVLDYWTQNKSLGILVELLENLRQDDLSMLVVKLRSLVQRITRCPSNKTTPLLESGGGKAVKLSKHHMPYVEQLLVFAIQVRDECSRRLKIKQVAVLVSSQDNDMDLDPDLDLFLEGVPDFDEC